MFVVACGAQPAPPAPRTLTKTPVVAPPPPAPITCGDVAVILRGKVEDERAAGPMKEVAIAKACLHDKWSTEIVDCVGSTTNTKGCLDKLDSKQRAAYRERLARWNDTFPDEALDEEAVDEDHLDFVACAKAVGDASQYAPVLTLGGEDRELATALRRHHILALCEDWSMEARRCFEQLKAPERCRTLLEPDQKQDLVDRLAEVDVLMAKVAVVAKKPASFACKQVVGFHYADARWKGKLDAMKPPERRKLIAESRALMLKACTDDRWRASLRSCLVAQGGEQCFVAAGIGALTWGFPASAIPIKTGIPECDAYGDALRALASCTAIPNGAAQTMLDGFQRIAPTYANMGAAERTAAAKSCAQSDAAIRQSARSLGCTI